ncbi:MAG: protein translocase subunit SecDF [Prevotella sp.]|nr:protein translocase subunit SecDF [Prevotella sp.]
MQNKGIVKFIAVALVLICCFYLSFSFVTSYYDNKIAKVASEKGQSVADNYKDSIETHDVWLFWNLKECREMEMGLGLDLKGGLNVIMEVSVPDVVDMLADYKSDPTYRSVFEEAKAKEKETQGDFVEIFCDLWKEKGGKRALNTIFATQPLREKVDSKTSDDDVQKVLKDEVDAAMENAVEVVRNRVDKFGVVQPNISRLEGQSRIMVELPGVKDKDRVLRLLSSSANLEFWETYKAEEVIGYLDRLMSEYVSSQAPAAEEETAAQEEGTADATESTEATDAAEGATAEAQEPVAEEASETEQQGSSLSDLENANNAPVASTQDEGAAADSDLPRLSLIRSGNATVGIANKNDTAAINKMLRSEVARRVLPHNLRLLWAAKGETRKDVAGVFFYLYAINTNGKDQAPLSGEVITGAKAEFDQMGRPDVTMQMNAEGARKWADLTRKNGVDERSIAIVMDDEVYSAPAVHGEIAGGNSQITGNFTVEDTKDLANTLNSGKVKAPMRILSSQMVGPSLGAKSIQQGIVSFIVAFILLMCVMILLYNFIPGMLANCALLLNLFFTLGILASFQAALTMPGIAGIVLTLGTAVDANVLIYERIKEEMRRGLHIRDAVSAGYSNAFSAIFDSNLTSLITGVILYAAGTGPIRGFATTLIIGICISFFTAVFLTRLVYDNRMKKDKWQNLTFNTPFSKNLMQNTKFNIMGQYKKSYTIWAIAAVLFIVSFAVRGLSRSIDFTGGRNYVVVLDKEVQVEDVRKALADAFVVDGKPANTSVIALEGKRTVRVSTNWNYESTDPVLDAQCDSILYTKLKEAGFITKVSFQEFVEEPKTQEAANGEQQQESQVATIASSMKVGPSIAKTITRAAFISVLLALIAIFLYILLRFRNVAFSVGSIVALTFDALIVIGFFSVLYGWVPMSLEIDQTFIGAILTVIGYSINDKVVVFDRIRENLKLYGKRDKKQLFNESINQTLARTINTSVTTLIVLLTIFILGGDSIRPFSFAMILGVIFGTLSSIFIAAPTAYLILSRKKTKDDKEVVTEKK